MLRPSLGRLATAVARRPAALCQSSRLASGITAARTPERTAELEALAEKHNGFLFGELVRPPPRKLTPRPSHGRLRVPRSAR